MLRKLLQFTHNLKYFIRVRSVSVGNFLLVVTLDRSAVSLSELCNSQHDTSVYCNSKSFIVNTTWWTRQLGSSPYLPSDLCNWFCPVSDLQTLAADLSLLSPPFPTWVLHACVRTCGHAHIWIVKCLLSNYLLRDHNSSCYYVLWQFHWW